MVSTVGFTTTVPLAATGPAPAMVIEVASVAWQLRTTLEPGEGDTGGLAVKLVIFAGCMTVTVAWAVTLL